MGNPRICNNGHFETNLDPDPVSATRAREQEVRPRLQSAMLQHIEFLHLRNRRFEAESSPAMLSVLLAMAIKNFDLGCDGRRCSTSN